MLRTDERFALVCALLSVLLLAMRMRTSAVLTACAGIVALLVPPRGPRPRRAGPPYGWTTEDHYHEVGWPPPPPLPSTPVDGIIGENKTAMATTETPDEGPAPHPQEEVAEEEGVTGPAASAAVEDDDPWRDPQLFIAEHVGALPYARFMRHTPDLHALGHPRSNVAPPAITRGRNRLARVVPVPTMCGYRDRTSQNSSFAHLR